MIRARLFGGPMARTRCVGVRIARDRSGMAAVEFALVFPMFLLVMFSTFEVGWFYFVNASVDAATIGIAREIRTGQIKGDDNFDVEEFFREDVCPKLQYFGDCDQRLTAEVEVFPDFATLAADTSAVTCRDDNENDVDNITVDPGGQLDIVRIRICLLYDTLNPAIGINLADETGKRRITSTYIIRNEPYDKNNRNFGDPSS